MFGPGNCQGINNTAVIGRLTYWFQPRKFGVHEANVKRCVVNNKFRAVNKFEELLGNFGELGFVSQKFIGDAVNRNGLGFNLAIRVDIDVVVSAGKLALHHFHAPDFDDAVTCVRVNTRGFGIQYNLSHCKPSNNIRNSNEATQAPVSPATPRFANSSASSLPGSPACPFTQCQLTWWRAVSLSSSCHRSAFLTGFLADVFQPLRFQPASHSVIPFRTYWESVYSST